MNNVQKNRRFGPAGRPLVTPTLHWKTKRRFEKFKEKNHGGLILPAWCMRRMRMGNHMKEATEEGSGDQTAAHCSALQCTQHTANLSLSLAEGDVVALIFWLWSIVLF